MWYINEHNEIKSQANGNCLDYNVGAVNAFMHPCHGGNNQKWYMDDLGQIKTLHDHRCLDYDTSFLQLSAEVHQKPAAEIAPPAPVPALAAAKLASKEARALLDNVRRKQEEDRRASNQSEASDPTTKKSKSYALQARLRAVATGMAEGTLKKTMAEKGTIFSRRRRDHNVYLHDCHGGTNQQWQFR
jgi:hypothetical protein